MPSPERTTDRSRRGSAVPVGTYAHLNPRTQRVQTLGYCRPSLRDEDGQILAALDKNVRAPITQGGGFGKIQDAHMNGSQGGFKKS